MIVECTPPPRVAVLQVAVLGVIPDKATWLQMVVVPSMKVTVPVGMPPLLVTVAVKVTETPYAEDVDDCWRLVDEFPLATVCVRGDDVDPGRFPSPPYTAVMLVWLPTASDDVPNVAMFGVPPDKVAVPSVVVPSLNVTVPVAPVVTVAVKVTRLP